MKNTKVTLAVVVSIWGVITCGLLFFMGNKNGDLPEYSIVVTKNADCSDESSVCTVVDAEASMSIAGSYSWGFETDTECVEHYGYACKKVDGEWRVLNEFTAKVIRSGGQGSIVMPVFFSPIHKGLYLPNGYPVVEGVNSTPRKISYSAMALNAPIPRKINSEFCGEGECRPLYQVIKENTYVSSDLAKHIFPNK